MNQTPIQVVDLGPVKGRALITTRKIEIDEVIFKERPLICCQLSWNRLNGHRCCDYCLKPLENPTDNARRLTGQNSLVLPAVAGVAPPDSPIPSVYCPTCRTEFCSNECFQASQSEYHTFICCENANNPFNALEEYWRSCHPMPETGTVMLLVRIAAAYLAAHALKSERAQHIVTALSRFVSSPVVEIPNEVGASSSDGSSSSATLAHRLMGPNFSGDLLNLHGLFKQCVAEMIRRTGAPGEFDAICQQIGLTNLLSDYGFCSAICLLGRNGQGIGCSSLGAWGRTAESVVNERGNPEECEQFSDFLDKLYITLDETVGENLNVEGVGLYEQQSKVFKIFIQIKVLLIFYRIFHSCM